MEKRNLRPRKKINYAIKLNKKKASKVILNDSLEDADDFNQQIPEAAISKNVETNIESNDFGCNPMSISGSSSYQEKMSNKSNGNKSNLMSISEDNTHVSDTSCR
ncbi:unnamed protein product [Brachionus calyciflorus]|uniref:Uncharacterized protein n=1 Tax=Brachionus calyciflorus TaxID=104777 RepID=A0A814FFP3_9BILA|nr:unnamed protein product [Brachionus calyciflorus]